MKTLHTLLTAVCMFTFAGTCNVSDPSPEVGECKLMNEGDPIYLWVVVRADEFSENWDTYKLTVQGETCNEYWAAIIGKNDESETIRWPAEDHDTDIYITPKFEPDEYWVCAVLEDGEVDGDNCDDWDY